MKRHTLLLVALVLGIIVSISIPEVRSYSFPQWDADEFNSTIPQPTRTNNEDKSAGSRTTMLPVSVIPQGRLTFVPHSDQPTPPITHLGRTTGIRHEIQLTPYYSSGSH